MCLCTTREETALRVRKLIGALLAVHFWPCTFGGALLAVHFWRCTFGRALELVLRHTWGRFTLRCCSLWCEGFAPLLVSSRVTIPPCVPLHHQKVCHATSHVFGRVTRKAAVSLEVVQRHAWGRFTLRCCSLWCEGFAPLLVSSRVTIPPCVPLHHQRSDRVQE